MKIIKIWLLILGIIVTLSCNPKNDKDNCAILIGDTCVEISQIDTLISKELYDILYRIYDARKQASIKYIHAKLIQYEAVKAQTSRARYLFSNIEMKIDSNMIRDYIKHNQLDVLGVPIIGNTVTYENPYTEPGHSEIIKALKGELENKLIDSLMKIYNVKILLSPPSLPKINMDSLYAHFRGNLDSKVTFWIISDLDCSNCKSADSTYQILYQRYKDSVRFAYIHFSSDLNLAIKASESASKQNKFWEMQDMIIKNQKYSSTDTATFLFFAKKLNLNISKFINDINDKKIAETLVGTMAKLSKKGLYGTPTIVLNNRILSEVFELNDFEEKINEQLNK